MIEERFNNAFEEIEAICRKYDMAAYIMVSDGTQTRSCCGFDWAKWSRLKQSETGKIGIPKEFKGRSDAEDFLPTVNMVHSFGEAAELIFNTCQAINNTAALVMKQAIENEARP